MPEIKTGFKTGSEIGDVRFRNLFARRNGRYPDHG